MATGFNTADDGLAEQLHAAKETAERCLELVKKQKRRSASVDTAFNPTVENLVEQLTRLSQIADTGSLACSASPLRQILLANLYLLRDALPLQPPPGADASLMDQLKTEIGNLLFRCDPRYEARIRAEQKNALSLQQLELFTQLMFHEEEQTKRKTETLLKQAIKNLEVAEMEKNEIEQKAQAQIRSLKEKLDRAEQEIQVNRKAEAQSKSLGEQLLVARQEKDEVKRKAEVQTKSLGEQLVVARQEKDDIEREAEAQTKSLGEQLVAARQEKDEIRRNADAQTRALRKELEETRQYKDKTESQATAQIALLDEKLKQLMTEKSHISEELRQAQQERERERQRFSSLLEMEIQLGEEFRCLLGQYESQKDFQTLTLEALSRIEKHQEEAAAKMADTEFRKQQGSLEEDFMNRLPDDVKVACLRIHRLIGGLGREFGEHLLGRHVAWSTEELEGSGLFFTRSKFWLCIRKWVEASSVPNTEAPLTLDHLTSVCKRLRVNPTTLKEISEEHESNLESNFVFLAKHVMVVEVAAFFRNKLTLTEEAWTFLLMPGTGRQKMDRLLAVVYSMGQEGYGLLLEALGSSCQQHVVARLTGGEAMADPYLDGSLLTTAAMAAVDADRDNTSRKTAVEAYRDNTSRTAAVEADRENTFKKSYDERTPDPPLSNKDEQPATVKAIRNLLEETTARQTAQIRQLLVEQLGNFKESLTDEISRTDQAAKVEGRYIGRVCTQEFIV